MKAVRIVRWWWSGFIEKVYFRVAQLLPRPLVYWATMRLIAHATQGKYCRQIVPDLKAMEAVRRWEGKN